MKAQSLFLILPLCTLALASCGKYPKSEAPEKYPLPDPVAWKSVEVNPATAKPREIQVVVASGKCWRVESKFPSKPLILVLVCDGTDYGARLGKASKVMEPLGMMRALLTITSRVSPVATEQMDGQSCLHYAERVEGGSMDLWLNTATHFPTRVDLRAAGDQSRTRYTQFKPDTAARGAEFFDIHKTEPLFSALLVP